MITPEYLNEIIKGTEDKLYAFQLYLIKKIANQIACTFDTENKLIPARISDYKKLLRTGMVKKDIENAVISEYPELEKEIKKAFLNSADEIADYNSAVIKHVVKSIDPDGTKTGIKVPAYKRMGIKTNPKSLNMTSYEIKVLEAMYKKTNATMKNICDSIPSSCVSMYVDVCDEAFLKVKHGVSMNTAICDAIKKVADTGIKVEDRTVKYTGRVDRIEVAIARAVRTGINQMNAQMILTRAGELGCNYVLTSQHVGARDKGTDDYTSHVNWQGKVYMLDWNNPALSCYNIDVNEKGFEWLSKIKKFMHLGKYKYPDFVKECGYGKIEGICGINCRHTFSMFFPEMENDNTPIDKEANKKQYEIEQKQRALERRIRRTKTDLEAYSIIHNDEAKKRCISLRAQLKLQSDEYMNYCRVNKLSPRNWSLKTK